MSSGGQRKQQTTGTGIILGSDLRSILLNENNQTQEATTYCVIPFIWHFKTKQSYGTESRSVVSGWRKGLTLKEHKETFLG